MAPTGRASAELQAQLTAQARGGGQGGCHLATLVARLRALSIALARGPHCVHIHVMIHEGHDDVAHVDDGRATYELLDACMPGFQWDQADPPGRLAEHASGEQFHVHC